MFSNNVVVLVVVTLAGLQCAYAQRYEYGHENVVLCVIITF